MEDGELRRRFEGGEPMILRGPASPAPPPPKAVAGLPVRDPVLFATSGSSGRPKWVVHTRASLRASARSVIEHLGIQPGEGWLRALPVHHVGGFGVLVRAWEAGAPVHSLPGRWRADAFRTLAGESGARWSSLVPTQVDDLMARSGGRTNEELPRVSTGLRGIIVGGGRLRPELEEAARRGGWPVLPSYGLSEAGSQVATRRPGEVGLRLLPGWELRRDPHGALLRGPGLAGGYLEEGDERWVFRALVDDDGWFQSRDDLELAREANGTRSVRVLGRLDDQIKILGELVSLVALQGELEALLEPGEDAALRARSDRRAEHRLVLQTRGMEPYRAGVVVTQFHQRVPPFVRVGTIEPVAEIRRSSLGKLLAE